MSGAFISISTVIITQDKCSVFSIIIFFIVFKFKRKSKHIDIEEIQQI